LATLEYDDVKGAPPPQRQPFSGTPVGVINEALAASDDMKAIMGMYDASLGQRSNETSGKAILARQREGDVGTFHFQDNLHRAIRHGGRILIDLAPKVYSTARVIRIIGPDKKPKMVQVGPADSEPMINGVEKIYDFTVGRYDLRVDAGPSFTTRREEAASQMMELIRVMPEAAPIIGDLLAENLDWPGAQEIAKRLKTLLPPQLQTNEQGQPGQPQGAPAVPPQIVEQAKQIIGDLQQQLQQANGELKKALEDNFEAKAKAMIDAYAKQTDRMKIMPGQLVPSPLPELQQPAAAPPPAPPPAPEPPTGQQPA
jgi:flagellar biosynthesis/type III secretory pathway chaperone